MTIQQRIQQAVSFHQQGKFAEAEHDYQTLLTLLPNDAGLLHLLGVLKFQLGHLPQAKMMIERAIAIDPSHATMHFNLGKVLNDIGEYEKSCASYRQAIWLEPDHAAAYANLGNTLRALSRYNESIEMGYQALQRNPRDLIAHQVVASGLRHTGDLERARKLLRKAYEISGQTAILFQEALLIPPMNDSIEAIRVAREKLSQDLDRLMQSKGKVGHPPTDIGMTCFYLSYHGLPNREILSKVAQANLKACPELGFVAEHCQRYCGPKQRIKVGFISAFMHSHSIGKTTRGIMAHLDRTRFEVLALFLAPLVDDEVSRFIRQNADASFVVPAKLAEARKVVAGLELDVLFYQDIGMEPLSYYLAFSRLAPVQCVSFGHPDTTGIPNMDWFVSSTLYEPADADEHYSERLFQLEQCGTLAYYYRPQRPAGSPGRVELGIPADKNIYLCPQTLFKLHPDIDPIIVGILQQDPNGCLVILAGSVKEWVPRFIERLRRIDPAVVDRVVVLGAMPTDRFTALVAAADVMLDTLHFNGMNTSLEAFAMGTPVVTMPTALQRGRHTAGMYARMGISDAVVSCPDDYIRIAVGLAGDKKKRADLANRILAANQCLFEDRQVVSEFERFFDFAIADVLGNPPQEQ